MTQIEKLDMILIGLTTAKLNAGVVEQHGSGYMMNGLCEILKIPLEKGEEKILEGILLANEYIEYSHPVAKILVTDVTQIVPIGTTAW